MNHKPTLFNRMCAAMSGEISADTLEAYRRASLAVYDALDHSEAHRARAKDEGKNAWTLEAATKAEILCTWNAFVLQTLGDRFLEADYQGDANTVGFVPAITSDQILRFYTQVEGWLNRAQQAHYNPNYKLDIYVPAELPPWSEVEPCPNAHLFGMLEAMRAVRDHTEAALIFLNDSPPQNDAQEKQRDRIRQQHASAMTKARYADDMMSGNPSREIHELVEEHVKDAIEKFYLLGQLLAMPELADKLQQTQPPQPRRRPSHQRKLNVGAAALHARLYAFASFIWRTNSAFGGAAGRRFRYVVLDRSDRAAQIPQRPRSGARLENDVVARSRSAPHARNSGRNQCGFAARRH